MPCIIIDSLLEHSHTYLCCHKLQGLMQEGFMQGVLDAVEICVERAQVSLSYSCSSFEPVTIEPYIG